MNEEPVTASNVSAGVDQQSTIETRLPEIIDRFAKLGGSGSGHPQLQPQSNTPSVCQMKTPQSCCKGLGYVLDGSSATIAARVCQCIERCQVCHGQTRMVIDGIARPCVDKSPRRIAGILNQAQLPSRYLSASFDSFANQTGNGRQVAAKLNHWAKNFSANTTSGLLIGGTVGVGKTFLLVALAKALAARGFSVCFADFFQLLSELKAGYSDGKADPHMMAPLLNCDVLIIDELGKGRNSEWEKTISDMLIASRYNRKRPVVASTNYALTAAAGPATSFNVDLERTFNTNSDFSPDIFGSLDSRVGSRVFSRLRETMEFIELTGDDFRKRGGHG